MSLIVRLLDSNQNGGHQTYLRESGAARAWNPACWINALNQLQADITPGEHEHDIDTELSVQSFDFDYLLKGPVNDA